jgi:NitT/TauT family transport system ATP-binding protein
MAFPVRRGKPLVALKELDFSLTRGEFCCIVGPTGCGKSTLLRIVAGLLRPTSGQVLIDNALVARPHPNVAMVFQSHNLLPWRTAIENVELGLEARKMPRRDRRARAHQWLGLVGLGDFTEFYPGQMSGGMQQRVGLARALAVEPDVLLMDEPFGSVDAQTRRVMQVELMRLHALDRKTVLFVTHDVEEAIYLADRVVVLGSRPAQVAEVVSVPFDRPRDDTVHGDPRFVALRETLWRRLIGVGVPVAEPAADTSPSA